MLSYKEHATHKKGIAIMTKFLNIFLISILVTFAYKESLSKQSALTVEITRTKSIGRFRPKNLVNFEGIKIKKCVIRDLKNLIDLAKKDGITLKPVSGYRSYEDQVKVFDRWTQQELAKDTKISLNTAKKRANKYSAKPGHSEHQLGTTIDLLSSENNYQFSSNQKLKYVKWLEKNAHKFNFKISYPENNYEYIYEPWHIRWWPK